MSDSIKIIGAFGEPLGPVGDPLTQADDLIEQIASGGEATAPQPIERRLGREIISIRDTQPPLPEQTQRRIMLLAGVIRPAYVPRTFFNRARR